MDIKKLSISYEEYGSLEELQASDRDLLEQSMKSTEFAYSPYSSFRVGAAIRLADGRIVTGNNQENAAYPLGLCAERVALFYAQSQFPDTAVDAIAIFAYASEFNLNQPITPCGACRQVIAEYEKRHNHRIRLIMGNGHGMVQIVTGAENLLPLTFYLEELKKH